MGRGRKEVVGLGERERRGTDRGGGGDLKFEVGGDLKFEVGRGLARETAMRVFA